MDFIQLLLFGINLSCIIALGAIGVSLVFGILRFAHFAHGDMMTLGAYIALVFVATAGLSIWLALPLAALATGAAALLLDRTVYRPLRRTRPVIPLIASVGVAFILRNVVLVVWGPGNVVYEPGITLPIRFAGLRIKEDQIVTILATLAIVVGLALFLRHTKTGKAMRAMSDDPDLARVTGINTDHVVVWTWAIAGALAAAAGVFLALDTRLLPTLGWDLLLPIFAATIVGGIGRPFGAVAGAFVIGISSELSTMWIAPIYKPAIAFALMVLVLLVRPTGIFAEARR